MKVKIKIMFLILLYGYGIAAHAELYTQEIKYQVGDGHFTGYLAYDDQFSGERPGILVVHEWWGHVAYARKRAEMLARLGYTAFALDMYGAGKVAAHPDTAKEFMQAVMNNMPEAKKRFMEALDILRNHATVNNSEVAAVGYCFGGGFALQMARSGVDLKGVVSVHGPLGTETPAKKYQVKAKLLVLTGEADPFVSTEQVQSFESEMKAAGVQYTVKSYPGAKHAFSNPRSDYYAEKFGMPLAYDKVADEDSWQRISEFLKNIFQ